MPYIGNTTSDFSIDTGNITNRAVTATKLSPSSVGSNGQVLSVDGSGNLQWSADASGTSLTGSTNNTITTVTGANAIQGEANLTFNGTQLTIGSGSSSVDHHLNFSADTGTFTLKHNRGNHKLELSDSDGTGNILAIDTNGKVGIGTTSPTTRLVIVQSADDSTGGLAIFDSSASSSFRIFRTGAGAGSVVSFQDRGSDVINIKDQLVGINTTNPTGHLHISSNNGAGIFIEDSSNTAASPYIQVLGKRSDANSQQNFTGQIFLSSLRTDQKVASGKQLGTVLFGGNHTDGTQGNILYGASIAGVADDDFDSATDMPTALVFKTGTTGRAPLAANVSSGDERLRIDSNGMIGIGGITPKTANTFNSIEIGSGGFIGSQTSAKTIELASNAYYNSGWKYKHSSVAASQYYQYTGYHEFSTAASGTADNAITFTPLLRLNANGNVGIGTTSPSCKLNIVGASGTNPTVQINHSDADVQGEFLRLARTDLPIIRYHSLVAQHGGAAANNFIGFKIHTGSTTTSQSDVLRIRGNGCVGINTNDPSAALYIDTSHYVVTDSGQATTGIHLDGTTGNAGEYGGGISFGCGASGAAAIAARQCTSDGDVVGLSFFTHDSGTGSANAVEKVRIMDGGVTCFNNGIGLGNSLTVAASNTLDDYEEGTWTPAITSTTGSVTSYYNQEGAYTKIGRMVKCHYRLRVNNAGDAAGNMMISGLPFTVGDTLASTGLDGSGRPTYWTAQDTNIVEMTMTPVGGDTKAYIYCATGATTSLTNLTDSNAFGNNWDIRAELMYFV